MTTIKVRSYERPKPERKPDPLQSDIEANRAALVGRYPSIPKPSQSRIRRTLFWLGRIWGK